MQAFDYWLRGKNCLDLWNQKALFEARAFFEKAIEIDPDYTRYAGLALTYEWAAFYTPWGGGDPTALLTLRLPRSIQPIISRILHWAGSITSAGTSSAPGDISRGLRCSTRMPDMLIHKAMILSLQGGPGARARAIGDPPQSSNCIV
jgi:hypothetical protein